MWERNELSTSRANELPSFGSVTKVVATLHGREHLFLCDYPSQSQSLGSQPSEPLFLLFDMA